MAQDDAWNVLEASSASLTLGKTGLEILHKSDTIARKLRQVIGYLFIIWAEIIDEQLLIDYAEEHKESFGVRNVKFSININVDRCQPKAWAQSLLSRAYAEPKQEKKIRVLINPHSGQGKAFKRYSHYAEPIFRAAKCQVQVQITKYRGHAQESIKNDTEIDSLDVIACCSGDGLPYEVINGLAERDDASRMLSRIPIVQLPGGSGNAMCVNLFGTSRISLAAIYIIKGIRQSLDLMSITQGNKRHISFLSQNLGFLAECDLGTERMRYLGGKRFLVGFLQRLFKPPVYACDIAICGNANDRQSHQPARNIEVVLDNKGQSMPSGMPPLRFGSVSDRIPDDWTLEHHNNLGISYAGQFPLMDATSKVFPRAKLDDGLVDTVRIDADIGFVKFLEIFRNFITGNHLKMAEVHYQKTAAYRVIPVRREGYLSVDGERFPCRPFQVEVHRGLGMTLLAPKETSEHLKM